MKACRLTTFYKYATSPIHTFTYISLRQQPIPIPILSSLDRSSNSGSCEWCGLAESPASLCSEDSPPRPYCAYRRAHRHRPYSRPFHRPLPTCATQRTGDTCGDIWLHYTYTIHQRHATPDIVPLFMAWLNDGLFFSRTVGSLDYTRIDAILALILSAIHIFIPPQKFLVCAGLYKFGNICIVCLNYLAYDT